MYLHGYLESIDKLKVKPYFCKFHIEQNINKRFKDYFDKNQLKDEEMDYLIELNNLVETLI